LSEDPNEAVKEVLRQILDEENRKSAIGNHHHLNGLSFGGGLASIPKFTKDIIRQELLHEKNHNQTTSHSVSGFTSSTTTSTSTNKNKNSNLSRRLN
jgi:hypothetical protein